VRLFAIPAEYWNQNVFMAIGNALGSYMMTADVSLQLKQMIYARIYVLMDLNKPSTMKISLVIDDEKWNQVLDYENILFRCRLCHEYRHLVRDCKHKVPEEQGEGKAKDDFIAPKKKQTAKKCGKEQANSTNTNRFFCLTIEEEEDQEELMDSQVPETQMDKNQTVREQQEKEDKNQMETEAFIDLMSVIIGNIWPKAEHLSLSSQGASGGIVSLWDPRMITVLSSSASK
ncbi:hypothetical protein KI387_039532, partial [Taxus chinensis]